MRIERGCVDMGGWVQQQSFMRRVYISLRGVIGVMLMQVYR